MTPEMPSRAAPNQSAWRKLPGALLIGGALAIVGLFIAAPPHSLWDKARLIGYALCHQMPERSFFFHEHQAPLCARCTGMYLGLLLGVAFLIVRRRTHAARLPSAAIVAVLIGFIIIMGIDGVNSTISIIPGAPQLYHTTNIHRLVTGSLFGLTMALLFLPMLNTAVWRLPSGDPSVKKWREFFALLVVTLAIDAVILTTPDWLLIPITLVSIIGPLFLLSFMGALIVLTLRNLANGIDRWRQMISPMIGGMAFGLILITFMDILRAAVTAG